MKSYYYALWIPQFKEGIPCVEHQILEESDLRDRDSDPPLLIGGEINKKTELISLQYKLGGSSYRTLLFHKINSINTGFIVFKLNLDDDEKDFLCESLRCSMPKAIYHCIKHFYHRHQFHNADNDSLLEAFFSYTPIDLSGEKTLRDIVTIYLQSYINKYAGCLDLCRRTHDKVSRNIRSNIQYDTSKELLDKVIENNKIILDGESLYCDFLINSYEKILCSDQIQRIYGLRSELAVYDDRLEQQKERLVSSYGLKLGKIGVWASVIGSLTGLFVSYGLSQCSSNELQDVVSDIRAELKRIQIQNSDHQQDIMVIKSQQDSILNLINIQDSHK